MSDLDQQDVEIKSDVKEESDSTAAIIEETQEIIAETITVKTRIVKLFVKLKDLFTCSSTCLKSETTKK